MRTRRADRIAASGDRRMDDQSRSPVATRMRHTVEIIGHRGAPRAYTENTIPSFRCALEGGADGLELDVHGTIDGVVVVHHDRVLSGAHLGRRGPAREIATLTYDEVAGLEHEREDRIPTLANV